MVNAYVQSTAPVVADGLKRGDIWIDVSGGSPIVKVCSQVDPSVQFVELGRNKLTPVADVAGTIPAGGTGAAAGGWDTAGNRDTAITTMGEIKTQLNLVLARLRSLNLIS